MTVNSSVLATSSPKLRNDDTTCKSLFHRCCFVSSVILVHFSRLRGTGQGLGMPIKIFLSMMERRMRYHVSGVWWFVTFFFLLQLQYRTVKVAQSILFLCMSVPPLSVSWTYMLLKSFFITFFIEYGGCECLFALYLLLCNKLNQMPVNPPSSCPINSGIARSFPFSLSFCTQNLILHTVMCRFKKKSKTNKKKHLCTLKYFHSCFLTWAVECAFK